MLKHHFTLSNIVELVYELIDLLLTCEEYKDISCVQLFTHVNANCSDHCLGHIISAWSLQIKDFHWVLSTVDLNYFGCEVRLFEVPEEKLGFDCRTRDYQL